MQDEVVGGNAIWRWTDESKKGELVRRLSAGGCLEWWAIDINCSEREKVGLWNMKMEVCYAI